MSRENRKNFRVNGQAVFYNRAEKLQLFNLPYKWGPLKTEVFRGAQIKKCGKIQNYLQYKEENHGYPNIWGKALKNS
jgi:hypothetical protein